MAYATPTLALIGMASDTVLTAKPFATEDVVPTPGNWRPNWNYDGASDEGNW